MKFLVDRCAGSPLAEWLLLFLEKASHGGLVRLPDVPAERRIELMAEVLKRHAHELAPGIVVTVRGARIRISKSPL